MLVEHTQTQNLNPITHKTIGNGGFKIKCMYGGDLSCQEITYLTHGRNEQDQLQHLPSISYWDWLRSKLQVIKHNETRVNHYVFLFHSSQIYYACPMDLLVTWGSNLTKALLITHWPIFPKVVFASNSSPLDKWASFFPQTDWVLVPLDIQQCSEDDLKSYTSNRGGECHRVGYCL